MAFVYETERNLDFNKNYEENELGPGQYLPITNEKEIKENIIPFLSSEEKLKYKQNDNPGPGTYYRDITKEEDIKNMVEQSINKFKKIDILINNAGIAIDTTFEDKTKENFMKTIDTNLIGPFLLSKYVGNYMLREKEGCIINISSTNGIDTYYEYSIDYDASKAGLISLTHNLALHFAPYIRVNAVAPGWIKTEMNKNMDEQYKKEEEKKILLKRFAEPEEIATVVYFLTTQEAKYINNETIRVDGGTMHA